MTDRHSLTTKLFHVSTLLIVVHQLLGSSLMEGPRQGRPGDGFYELHQWTGLAGLAILTLFWLWVLVRRHGTPASAMLPWFSSSRRATLMDDLRLHLAAARTRRWLHSVTDALASATHGLGLLTALVMAATGAATLTGQAGTAPHDVALSIHKVFANLMWAYVIGHALVAVLHHFAGDDRLFRMFGFSQQKRDRSAEETHS